MIRASATDEMSSRNLLGAVLIVAALGVFMLVEGRLGITRAQLIAILPVTAGLCLVTGRSLKTIEIIVGLMIALVPSAIFVISPNQSNESVAIAALNEDPAGAHTRSLRVAIVQASSGKIDARTLPQRLGKFEKREALLASESNITVLITGSTKWLDVSTKGELKELATANRKTLWLSRQLPEFGINPNPAPQTAKFLADLAQILKLPVSDPTRQSQLRALGELAAPWRSQSHRATPWILLAADQLEKIALSFKTKSDLDSALNEIRFSLDRAAHFAPPRFAPRLALTARHIKTCMLTLQAFNSNSEKQKKAAILANKKVIGVLKGKPRSVWRYNIAKASKRNIQAIQG